MINLQSPVKSLSVWARSSWEFAHLCLPPCEYSQLLALCFTAKFAAVIMMFVILSLTLPLSKHNELEAQHCRIQSKYMILLQESQAPRMGKKAPLSTCVSISSVL